MVTGLFNVVHRAIKQFILICLLILRFPEEMWPKEDKNDTNAKCQKIFKSFQFTGSAKSLNMIYANFLSLVMGSKRHLINVS